MSDLYAFLAESNRIEGIDRVSSGEIVAADMFLRLERPRREGLVRYVWSLRPRGVLRDKAGLSVRVGNHIAPEGGGAIVGALDRLLSQAAEADGFTPFQIHCAYENLHPFTDGNGRSGRLLWLWTMRGEAPLGFLHTWYYQSLDAQDSRK